MSIIMRRTAGIFVPTFSTVGTAVSHTGDTSETVLGWINVPGGIVGKNGAIELDTVWKVTGSAGSWVLSVRIITGTSNGTTGGTGLISGTVSAGANVRSSFLIYNKNAANSQEIFSNPTGSFTATSNGMGTSTVDMSAAFTLSLNAKLNAGADTIALQHAHSFIISNGT